MLQLSFESHNTSRTMLLGTALLVVFAFSSYTKSVLLIELTVHNPATRIYAHVACVDFLSGLWSISNDVKCQGLFQMT